ncbi:MAG: phosphoribosylanthranilate isomerase [Sphingobacteriales bacterium]|nr:phosphoribosylanthranilate isomerase [Sphingobacteriales bacterium]
MNIKVCGITQLKQLQQLDGLNIDFAGFIFHKDSPRYVGDKIDKDEMQNADFDVKKVGVFVNAGYDEIMDTVEDYGLDIVQLHGDETPELCEQLMEDVEVIKVFSIGDEDVDIDELVADYDEVCDYYLFDTVTKEGKSGGTGKKFDWKKIAKSKIEKPFFLSGGISVEDVAQIKTFKHPDYYGIDVNSKFEKSPGIKDMALLLQLKQGLKNK